MDLFKLNNKTILVTGASSGIGKAIAIVLAELGANVIITGRDSSRLEDTLAKLKKGSHTSIIADLSDEASIHELTGKLPNLNGLVHSAGILNTLPFKFINKKSMTEIMDINFIAPTLLTQGLLKSKKITSGGSIVYISSIAGNLIGMKGNAMYSASKGAINATVKVLALELASQKIRVNNVAPGMIKTEAITNSLTSISAEQLSEDEKKYPLGYGLPEDVANAVAFLLCDESRWITGSTLVLDGGFTIQ